jgi:hypothetical protein
MEFVFCGAMKMKFMISSALLAVSAVAHAGLILGTDFTGVDTTNGPTATGITWTPNGVVLASTDLTFTGIRKSDGTAYSPAFFSAKGTPADNIQINANIETTGPWSFSFTLTPSSAISLTNFTLGYRAITGSGADQGPARSAVYTLAISQGATSLGSAFDNVSDAGGGTPDGDVANIDLSTFALSAGVAYTFTLTVSSSGTLGNNVAIDNLALNGNITAVPEPGSTGVVVAAAAVVLGAARGLRRPK